MVCAARTSAAVRIVVAAASDEAYALPLAVMLRSAAETLGPDSIIEAYVASHKITAHSRSRVESSLPPSIAVRHMSTCQSQNKTKCASDF